MCEAAGKVVSARVADHVVDHAGNWNEFRTGDCNLFASTATPESTTVPRQRGYSNEIDAKRHPVDGRHPFYKSAVIGGMKGRTAARAGNATRS